MLLPVSLVHVLVFKCSPEIQRVISAISERTWVEDSEIERVRIPPLPRYDCLVPQHRQPSRQQAPCPLPQPCGGASPGQRHAPPPPKPWKGLSLLEGLRHLTYSKIQQPWRLLRRSLHGRGRAVPWIPESDFCGSEDFRLPWVICFSLACNVKSNNACVPQFKIVYTWMITQHDYLLSHTNLMIC